MSWSLIVDPRFGIRHTERMVCIPLCATTTGTGLWAAPLISTMPTVSGATLSRLVGQPASRDGDTGYREDTALPTWWFTLRASADLPAVPMTITAPAGWAENTGRTIAAPAINTTSTYMPRRPMVGRTEIGAWFAGAYGANIEHNRSTQTIWVRDYTSFVGPSGQAYSSSMSPTLALASYATVRAGLLADFLGAAQTPTSLLRADATFARGSSRSAALSAAMPGQIVHDHEVGPNLSGVPTFTWGTPWCLQQRGNDGKASQDPGLLPDALSALGGAMCNVAIRSAMREAFPWLRYSQYPSCPFPSVSDRAARYGANFDTEQFTSIDTLHYAESGLWHMADFDFFDVPISRPGRAPDHAYYTQPGYIYNRLLVVELCERLSRPNADNPRRLQAHTWAWYDASSTPPTFFDWTERADWLALLGACQSRVWNQASIWGAVDSQAAADGVQNNMRPGQVWYAANDQTSFVGGVSGALAAAIHKRIRDRQIAERAGNV